MTEKIKSAAEAMSTVRQARQVLLAEQMDRVQKAQREGQIVYEKHKVILDVCMIVRGSGTIVQAQLVPREGWVGGPRQ